MPRAICASALEMAARAARVIAAMNFAAADMADLPAAAAVARDGPASTPLLHIRSPRRTGCSAVRISD